MPFPDTLASPPNAPLCAVSQKRLRITHYQKTLKRCQGESPTCPRVCPGAKLPFSSCASLDSAPGRRIYLRMKLSGRVKGKLRESIVVTRGVGWGTQTRRRNIFDSRPACVSTRISPRDTRGEIAAPCGHMGWRPRVAVMGIRHSTRLVARKPFLGTGRAFLIVR